MSNYDKAKKLIMEYFRGTVEIPYEIKSTSLDEFQVWVKGWRRVGEEDIEDYDEFYCFKLVGDKIEKKH